ncbi:hypothetical protein NDU88_007329 [Pleurodeles waltl]|uniref:Uncharacterized protein n=1 Tax=Pleurodeles waltl TaxID=8319 RepID=A0AAV7QNF6_PLEWA|nr:hypothetical protein NDU88_007329 [Pleurodeles waltl]
MWTRTRPVPSYEARAALGRGEESQVPVSDSGERRPGCRDRRREACPEGPGWAGPELRGTNSVGQKGGELSASE